MTLDISSASLDRVISMAIRSEIDAAAIYEKLITMVNNFVLREKLAFLAEEEKNHQKVLESLFEKMFPGKEPDPDEKGACP